MISDPQELYGFLSTPGIEVAALMFARDDVAWASWQYIAEENVPNVRHTNEVVATYVTAEARIHLYSYIHSLQEGALYFDTDSVTYIQPIAEPPLVQTGHCLGAMTSELKPVFHSEEYVSGGPKNYAYRVVDPVTGSARRYVKSKENAELQCLPDVKWEDSETVTVHTERKIKRKRADGKIHIVTEPEDKTYNVSFLKRRRLCDNTSV